MGYGAAGVRGIIQNGRQNYKIFNFIEKIQKMQ